MYKILYLILYSAEQESGVSFPRLLDICKHQTGTVFCLQQIKFKMYLIQLLPYTKLHLSLISKSVHITKRRD
jgi:hypothetical protein